MADSPDLRAMLEKAVRKLQAVNREVEQLRAAQREPIAIVGMACRFPHHATTADAFWQTLSRGEETSGSVASRWQELGVQPPPDGAAGTQFASLIDGFRDFDAEFFGISAREAAFMDPAQRLLLAPTWEAIEDAGYDADSLRGAHVGVYVGTLGHDYEQLLIEAGAQRDLHAVTGVANTFTSGRISYVFGWQGPCVNLDTACTSSLVAAHLACQSPRAKESQIAVVGGVNLILSPVMMDMLGQTETLAADGHCKTFDATADGYVRAEACGVLVLKRLSDALTDKNHIHALIRGTAINQDGASSGLTAPNPLAQVGVMQQALESAQVTPEQIDFLEAHGTGTKLGDSMEVEALQSVYGKPRASKLYIGSVKTNLGHPEAAAGMASLFKIVLSLKHETLPRHLNLTTLNPMLAGAMETVTIPLQNTAWPQSATPRIAAINGIALSGTNAHMIVQEPPAPARSAPARTNAQLVTLSARSAASLQALARAYLEYIGAHPNVAAEDLAYTTTVCRAHHDMRIAAVVHNVSEWTEALHAVATGTMTVKPLSGGVPRIALAVGESIAPWTGIGCELLHEPAFRTAVQACDTLMTPLLGWSVAERLASADPLVPDGPAARPIAFCVQVALAALWRAWGVPVEAVVGTGVAEITAAYVAGALPLAEAVRAVCASNPVSMASLNLQPAELTLYPASRAHAVAADGFAMVIELSAQGSDAKAWRPALTLPALRAALTPRQSMLTALAALYTRNMKPAFASLFDGRRTPLSLPTYAWENKPYWHAAGATRRAVVPTSATTAPANDDLATRAPALRAQVITAPPEARAALLVAFVQRELAHVLHHEGGALREDVGFKRLGLDSLMGLELQNRLEVGLALRDMGKALPASVIADPGITIVRVAALLQSLLNPESRSLSCADVHGQDATVIRAAEVRLDAFLRDFKPEERPSADSGARGHVLLTGANGYLGRFLLMALFERTAASQETITCIIRAPSDAAAAERLAEAFAVVPAMQGNYLAMVESRRLVVMAGDLASSRLGLDEAKYRSLANSVSCIVHNGALVNHVFSYAQLFEPNVLGTVELMKLALCGRMKTFNFLSTMAVTQGLQRSDLVREDEDAASLASEKPTASLYGAGYATSKWVCELLLRQLHDQHGVPVTVFRCDMMMAHRTLPAQINVTDFFTRLLLGIVKTGCAPASFYAAGRSHGFRFDGMPVDYAAQAIAALSKNTKAGWQIYHVSNPHHRSSATLDDVVDAIVRAGHPVERMADYGAWYAAFAQRLGALDKKEREQSALPVLHLWEQPLAFEVDLDASQFRAQAMQLLGIDVPVIHEASVRHYLDTLAALHLL